MRNFKSWLGLLAVVLLLSFTSCQKPIAKANEEASISFAFDIPDVEKKNVSPKDQHTPECVDAIADYATVKLQHPDATVKWYTLDLLALGDGTITEALKLLPGTYIIQEFYVFSDEDADVDGYYPNDAPQNTYPDPDGSENDDDLVMYASPYENSYYDNLFNFTFNVPHEFTLKPFEKQENYVDVLCYRPAYYEDFGFKHWDYHAFEVKEKCFYGDICTKFWEDFRDFKPEKGTNPYYGWPQHYDLYGVFEVVVKNPARVDENGTVIPGALTKATNYPFNPKRDISPVCVEYLDDLEVDGEIYYFDLWVYLPNGQKINIYSGTFTDEHPNPFGWQVDEAGVIIGGDGVFTWQIGDCTHPSADIELILPAWVFLPQKVNADVVWKLPSPTHPNYQAFDVTLLTSTGGIMALYPDEFKNLPNMIGGYCGDVNSPISNGNYDFDVYSSLYITNLPVEYQAYPWGALNWLINQGEAVLNSSLEGEELQAILWLMIHGDSPAMVAKIAAYLDLTVAEVNTLAPFAANVVATYSGFTPRTGDWSLVLLDPVERGDQKWQLVIVRVDP